MRILVIEDEKKVAEFISHGLAEDWKAISLDKLEKDQQVRVQYVTNKDGFLVALSIKPLK